VRGHYKRRVSHATALQRYPRTARVNELLREVLADALERLADEDERLTMLTVTGVEADPDLRHAKVYLAHIGAGADTALGEARARLQAAVGSQVRLKRTPLLSFLEDPAVSNGEKVEDILRGLAGEGPGTGPGDTDGGDFGVAR
jgi:ribosome-binding factor A